MDKNNIPNEVNVAAKRLFPHGAVLIGEIEGKKVYSEAEDPNRNESEPSEPTGLPIYLLWDGNKVDVISGLDSLDLRSRLK